MKLKLVMMILVLAIPFASANIHIDSTIGMNQYIEDNQNITIQELEEFVRGSLTYELRWFPNSIYNTWYYWVGDCTDIATMIHHLAGELNITTRLMHGMVRGFDEEWDYHDWYEYHNGTEWINPEKDLYWSRVHTVGKGIWSN